MVILRDRDYSTDWYGEDSDGVLETRAYYCQNWRHDVSAIVTSGGAMIEWAKYSAYGVPFGMSAGDANSNGLIDVNDYNQMNTWIAAPAYDVRGDLDLDGDIDINDLVALNNTGYPTLGRGVLSRAGYSDNRKGYAGYEHAAELLGTQWHVRHRVLDSELGRWTRRDPAEYVDGMNVYLTTRSAPLSGYDPTGLVYLPCTWGGTIGGWFAAGTPMGEIPGPWGPGGEVEWAGKINCCMWAERQINELPNWLPTLPDCPCTIGNPPVNPNPANWTNPSPPSCCHPGAAYCMRSTPPTTTNSGQQCCYDSNGNLITGGPGAGTPDRTSPGDSVIWHYLDDVGYFKNCEKHCLGNYLEARPPNPGKTAGGQPCPSNTPGATKSDGSSAAPFCSCCERARRLGIPYIP